jgi:hypothetical protein
MHGNNLQLSYYLKEGHEFKGEFMIGNYTDDPINYYVICLVDYNKQVFLFNGEKGDVHSVSLKSKERVIYPMAIGGLKKGAHDLLLVAIKKTSDDFDKVDFPILSYRANLFIESYSFPPVPYVINRLKIVFT